MLLIETESFIPSFLINFKLKYDNRITACLITTIEDYDFNHNELIEKEFDFNLVGYIKNNLPPSNRKILPYIYISKTESNYPMNKFYEFIKTPFDYFQIENQEFYSKNYNQYYLSGDFLFESLYNSRLLAFKVLNKKTKTFNWVIKTKTKEKIMKLLPEKTIKIELDNILTLSTKSNKMSSFYEMYNKNKHDLYLKENMSKSTYVDFNNSVNIMNLFNFNSPIYAGLFPNGLSFFAF